MLASEVTIRIQSRDVNKLQLAVDFVIGSSNCTFRPIHLLKPSKYISVKIFSLFPRVIFQVHNTPLKSLRIASAVPLRTDLTLNQEKISGNDNPRREDICKENQVKNGETAQ